MERYSAAASGRGRDGQDGGRGRRGRGRGGGLEGGPARGAGRGGRGVRGGRGGGVGGIVDWGPAGGRFRGSTSSAPSVQTRIEPQNISTEELPGMVLVLSYSFKTCLFVCLFLNQSICLFNQLTLLF